MDDRIPSRPKSLDPVLHVQRRSRGILLTSSRRDSWASCQTDSPYAAGSGSRLESILSPERYSVSPDPREWNFDHLLEHREDDDVLHNPDTRVERDGNVTFVRGRHGRWRRCFTNLGCVLVVCLACMAMFIAIPIMVHFRPPFDAVEDPPVFPMRPHGPVDPDTPLEVYEKSSRRNPGDKWKLVFSDEFNVDGRSFYPGDDPYWEAADLHYWPTNNLEWYDPAAVTTAGGFLVITLEKYHTHGLNYSGGLISSWNKFCFTGGLLETAVVLPGLNNVMGLWPAIWTMGNLGRVGYGATLDGLWPYSYDACDVGTLPNQTLHGLPAVARQTGDPYHNFELSYLPGQRLSRCTCPEEDHPGPRHHDGSFVGRAAPEIDCFEGKVFEFPKGNRGEVSQSAQWAPFNAGYAWLNTSKNMVIADPYETRRNPYMGGVLQQVTSALTPTDQFCYMRKAGCFEVYGFEYKPGFDDAYITWIANDLVTWTLNVAGMAADPLTQISSRPVSQEPMYIIINLGLSTSFGIVDLDHLVFPNHMRVDYIRVYQSYNAINIGCSPPDFPTESYINRHLAAYTNPNLTTWTDDYGKAWPKNRLLNKCKLPG